MNYGVGGPLRPVVVTRRDKGDFIREIAGVLGWGVRKCELRLSMQLHCAAFDAEGLQAVSVVWTKILDVLPGHARVMGRHPEPQHKFRV